MNTTTPTFILSLATGKQPSNNLGCQVSGFFIHTLSNASILVMTLTAISRYYCVFKSAIYRRLFTFHRTICYNVLEWRFATSGILLILIFGRARIAFNPLAVNCIITLQNENSQVAYTLYKVLFYMVFCLSIICFCYNRVSRFIHSQPQHRFPEDSRYQSDQSPVCTDIFVCHSMGTNLYPSDTLSCDSATIPRSKGNGSCCNIL